jgi:hypothetical protein
MPLSPDQILWIEKASTRHQETLKGETQALNAKRLVSSSKEAGGASLKLSDHLINTGRAPESGDLATAQAREDARATREDTAMNIVTERIELSANATYVSERLVRIAEINAGPPLMTPDPVRHPLLLAHPSGLSKPNATHNCYKPSGNVHPQFVADLQTFTAWKDQRKAFQDEMKEDSDARALGLVVAPLQADAAARLEEFKAFQPEQYRQTWNAVAGQARLREPAIDDAALDALTDRRLMQVYLLNAAEAEIDAEIDARIAALVRTPAFAAGVDGETRLEVIADSIEAVGAKYQFTNLAHFMSRHGAERTNPATGKTKRPRDDAVARIATGVAPDEATAMGSSRPAKTIAGNVGGNAVSIPEYTTVGKQPATKSSQHASAKAALFMLEEGASQTELVSQAFALSPGQAVKVEIGTQRLDGDTLGQYPEAGGLGDSYGLKAGSAHKKTMPKKGVPLSRATIAALLADIEQTPGQQGATVTSLPDRYLGGHTPMTMFSNAQATAGVDYTPAVAGAVATPVGSTRTNAQDALKATRDADLAAAKRSADDLLNDVQRRKADADNAVGDAELKRKDAQDHADLALASVDTDLHRPLLDGIAAQSRALALAREKAAASAGVASEGRAAQVKLDEEVDRATRSLSAAKIAKATPHGASGSAKTSEELARDDRAVEDIGRWHARALARQDELRMLTAKTLKEEDEDRRAVQSLQAALAAEVASAAHTVPAESLAKVAALADATATLETAQANAQQWQRAEENARVRVAEAEEALASEADPAKALADALASSRQAKAQQAQALARGPHAREDLDRLLVQELEAIDAAGPVDADKSRTLAKNRARAEVKARIANALLSVSDVTPQDRAEALKAQARHAHAVAEEDLDLAEREVAKAEDAAIRAAEAERRANTATAGKTLTDAQQQYLANVRGRASRAAQTVIDLKAAGGRLETALETLEREADALRAAEAG